jgi:hypothetical protein
MEPNPSVLNVLIPVAATLATAVGTHFVSKRKASSDFAHDVVRENEYLRAKNHELEKDNAELARENRLLRLENLDLYRERKP